MTEEITLEKASQLYLAALTDQGKSKRTIYTYGKDLEQIIAFFGPERKLRNILPPHISKFLQSPELRTLTDGRERASSTIQKTVGVFKMLFNWALKQGYIDSIPFSKERMRLRT